MASRGSRPSQGTLAYGKIFDGAIQNTPFRDAQGVIYYAVQFGSKDHTSGYGRLDSQGGETSTANGATYGDYSDFQQLGEEVRSAIAAIKTNTPLGASTKILLLGHSRGGVTARAFLQSNYVERSSVVGLATLGTPHWGSRLARIYDYLKNNPRNLNPFSTANADWNAAEDLFTLTLIFQGKGLNVTRPTIKFLADNSTAINSLSNNIVLMPSNISYGLMEFSGVHLGDLNSLYDAFNGGFQLAPGGGFSSNSLNYILDGRPIGDFLGDGIVHLHSQRFYEIPGFPRANVMKVVTTAAIRHTEETDRVTDIDTLLKSLVNWWGN